MRKFLQLASLIVGLISHCSAMRAPIMERIGVSQHNVSRETLSLQNSGLSQGEFPYYLKLFKSFIPAHISDEKGTRIGFFGVLKSSTTTIQNLVGIQLDGGPSGGEKVWPSFQVSWRLGIASILAFLAAALANAGGIGGGPLFVPLFNLLLGYDAKTSAALSKSMVFGGSFASLIFNIKLKQPTVKNRALIDYDIASLMQPTLLLGISIGVAFNVIFPGWLMKALLCSLLFFMAHKTLGKGKSTWDKESQLKAVKEKTIQEADVATEEGAESSQSRSFLGRVQKSFSFLSLVKWTNVGELSFVWVAYFCVQLAKGFVGKCGAAFWILEALQVPIAVLVSYFSGKRLLAANKSLDHSEPLLLDEQPQQGTRDWGVQQVAVAPLFSLLAGVMGGLLGIGGAVVMGPVLLELGLQPQVSTATSSFMILFSSSMSVVEFYLLGRIPLQVALYFGFIAFMSAFVGLSVVRALVVKLGKASIIIFVLGGVIGLSGVVILIVGGEKIYEDWNAGAYMGFSGLCDT